MKNQGKPSIEDGQKLAADSATINATPSTINTVKGHSDSDANINASLPYTANGIAGRTNTYYLYIEDAYGSKEELNFTLLGVVTNFGFSTKLILYVDVLFALSATTRVYSPLSVSDNDDVFTT